MPCPDREPTSPFLSAEFSKLGNRMKADKVVRMWVEESSRKARERDGGLLERVYAASPKLSTDQISQALLEMWLPSINDPSASGSPEEDLRFL